MSFLRCVYLEACLMKVTKLHLCGSIGRWVIIFFSTENGEGEEKQIRYERMNEMC